MLSRSDNVVKLNFLLRVYIVVILISEHLQNQTYAELRPGDVVSVPVYKTTILLL